MSAGPGGLSEPVRSCLSVLDENLRGSRVRYRVLLSSSAVMGASFSEPCCGTNRRAMEELVPPLRSISVLEDDRVHFLNDSPMCCLVKNSLWEQNMTAIKDVNGTTLFHVNSTAESIQLILPTLSCHADVTADSIAGCWYICMGRERRVVIKKHVSSENQLIFLVHALKQPFPSRDSLHTSPLPHPCLSVRGDFFSREYSVFDCSGLDARRVARSVRFASVIRKEQVNTVNTAVRNYEIEFLFPEQMASRKEWRDGRIATCPWT